MADTLITIPGVTANHVLGEATVTLGAGDLNIVATAGGAKELNLTVGGAAFSLRKGVEFGTLEGDSRAYVFSPEIEGVNGGYVKLSLPEGVTEDGSRFSELQTRFEEILIEHGLLQPAEESSARQRIKDAIASRSTDSLVTIPGAVAAQVLGEETTILSEGTLSLVVIPTTEGTGAEPLVTLTVGHAAFPLHKTTTFGTLADDSRTYLFTPQVDGIDQGFVAIVLPEATEHPGSDLAELQNDFELALIEYGLLKDGFEAAADEVGRSVREDSARTAQRIRDAKALYLETHPRTADPAHFSKTSHGVAGGTASSTQSVADAAHWVSGAVTSVASSAGAWIASTFVPTRPSATENLDAAARGVSTIVEGISTGVGEVTDTVQDAAGEVVENDYGAEARDVAGNVGQGVANVGAVAKDAATVTSGAALAVAGLQGAAKRQDAEQQQAEGDISDEAQRT
ncbi:hypothetical protein C2E23DRAFT_887020 [Lenzites betulinus]|nr:hypothetical protein C2E23DRAFT_887020 [Lenzites betulinus]